MTTSVHTLADGTRLQRKGSAWFDPVSQRYVDHDRVPGSLTVPGTEPPEIVRPVNQAALAAPEAKRRSKAAADGSVNGERFHTVNAFVDDIARHLLPIEVAVWLTLWRRADARSNVAEITIEGIGDKLGRGNRAIQRAVEWLTRCGLVERISRGTRQTGASRYRLEPRPLTRLAAVEQAAAERDADRRPRLLTHSQPVARDQLGRFST